jgi:hypothetical protein
VGASSNCIHITALTVAIDEMRPSLLGHHSNVGIIVADRLPVDTEGYRPLVQRCIIVVILTIKMLKDI